MVIRRTPQDFVVTELLTREAASGIMSIPAAWSVWKLHKTSLTTPDACAFLAKSLGLKPSQIEYAGLKDKHAVTTQFVCAPAANPPLPVNTARADRNWDATLVGYATLPLQAAAIQGNSFQIVIRDMTQRDIREMGRRASILRDDTTLFIANYFGDQRFSAVRSPEAFVAPLLIRSEFEAALKILIATPWRKDTGKTREFTRTAATHWGQWPRLAKALPRCAEYGAIEVLAKGGSFADAFAALPFLDQQMSVEAFQSHIWNRMLYEMCARSVALSTARSVDSDDPFGPMVFPAVEAIPTSDRAYELPLLAPETRLPTRLEPAASAALAPFGLSARQLRIPHLRKPQFGEALRPTFVRASELQIQPPEPDELGRPERLKRTLSFTLPRGSYATVVLRALGQ